MAFLLGNGKANISSAYPNQLSASVLVSFSLFRSSASFSKFKSGFSLTEPRRAAV